VLFVGTGNDVSNLQSFFGDILGYRVDTKSNDLSRADVIRALQSARDNIRSGATHEYFPFICAILSHGDEVTQKSLFTLAAPDLFNDSNSRQAKKKNI
jgi:hypothetical protein